MPALVAGDFAPWFTPAVDPAHRSKPDFSSGQDFIMGGYRAALFFFGSIRDPQIEGILTAFHQAKAQFAQQNIHFFAIGIDPQERRLEQVLQPSSHFHWLWDFGGDISLRYGLCQIDQDGSIVYDPTTYLLDENLRILELFPLKTNIAYSQQVLQSIAKLPRRGAGQVIRQQAPVLLIPDVLPLEFCQTLIDGYVTSGGTESGFMRQEGQNTVIVLDPKVKRRRDWLLTEPALLKQLNRYLGKRLIPEIAKVFQFRATRFERYTVACYEAANQGFFQPHRDNTAQGNVHRRFAMTLNLNADYEGGCLRFPEYSSDLYSPSPGSVIVFSCSLLHEATPVISGQRLALLSFFYGDEDAQLRRQTQSQIVREDSNT